MNRIKRYFRHGNIGYLFVLPAMTYMLLLVGYPIVSNFILSIQDVTVTTLNALGKPLVGLRNYQTLLADGVLQRSLGNTFVFTVCCLVFQFGIGFALYLGILWILDHLFVEEEDEPPAAMEGEKA